MSVISKVKDNLLRFFFKKDRNYFLGLSIGIMSALFISGLYLIDVFNNLETYMQALIYQIGYQLPDNTGLVTVVKKDQTTSSLINKDPGRREYASLLNLLASTQKADRIYKSRCQGA